MTMPTMPTTTTARVRVAFQGERGAFSELAIRHWWPATAEPLPCRTFDDVLEALRTHAADAAVLPVENRIVGPVRPSRDALARAGAAVVATGDVVVPIRHALLAPAGATLEGLVVVRSHPVALAQCARFLEARGWRTDAAHDTAGAAREVAEARDPTVAAIAPASAAARYGLVVLADAIQDVPDNWTRFVRLERARR